MASQVERKRRRRRKCDTLMMSSATSFFEAPLDNYNTQTPTTSDITTTLLGNLSSSRLMFAAADGNNNDNNNFNQQQTATRSQQKQRAASKMIPPPSNGSASTSIASRLIGQQHSEQHLNLYLPKPLGSSAISHHYQHHKQRGHQRRIDKSPSLLLSSPSTSMAAFLSIVFALSFQTVNLIQVASASSSSSSSASVAASNNQNLAMNSPVISTLSSTSTPANGAPNGLQLANSNSKPRYRTMYACEDRQLTIDCDYGMKINLIRANYGRFSITQCNEQGQLDLSTDCMSPITFRIMRDRCADKQKCSVNATSSIFGDKCPKTRKYLEVHFICQPDPQVAQVDAFEKVDLREVQRANHQLSSSQSPSPLSPTMVLSPTLSSQDILPPNNNNNNNNLYSGSSPSRHFDQADYNNNNNNNHEAKPTHLNPQLFPPQPMRVINSEIVAYGQQQEAQMQPDGSMRPLELPFAVTFRHKMLDNMSNPRCFLWDTQTNQWTERGGSILDSNQTHTTCAFDQATSYVLVMDYFNPKGLPASSQQTNNQQQQQQQQPQNVGEVMGPMDPKIMDMQPVALDSTKISLSNANQQQQMNPSIITAPNAANFNNQQNSSSNGSKAASALFSWLFIVITCLIVAVIAFVASSMMRSMGAGAALKSLGNFSAFSSGNSKYKGRNGSVLHRGPDGTLHNNKDLLVINNSAGHQFLYAPASTTKISSSSSTHILAAGGQGVGAGSQAASLNQIGQPLYAGANGTLSNLSGTGTQSNNYYYGLMGLTPIFQQQQQQQQQQLNQMQQLQQHQNAGSYHHQANKSTISTESANSTPSSSGVESGSTSVNQHQQANNSSCLIMSNDYNLMGSQATGGNGHYSTNQQQPQLTLNAHYTSSGHQNLISLPLQQQQQQLNHNQRLFGGQQSAASAALREHIYECVDDVQAIEKSAAYASRLLMLLLLKDWS